MTEAVNQNKLNKGNLFMINFGLTIPNQFRNSFQSIFAYIKIKFHIKNSRKSYIDSVLKKCKGKFIKAVNECFQKCISIKVKCLPQEFITNISISYNKFFLNKKLIDVYKYFNLINEDTIQEDHIFKDKIELFKYLCNSTISELYFLYLESKIHKREIIYIRELEGKKFAYLYQFVSDNFTLYYEYNKPNKKKEKSNGNIISSNMKNKNKFFIVKKI